METLELYDTTVLEETELAEIDGGCFICRYLGPIIWPHSPTEPQCPEMNAY